MPHGLHAIVRTKAMSIAVSSKKLAVQLQHIRALFDGDLHD
jgi:hypothetical protein